MTISELELEEELPAQPAASRATHATRPASTVVGRRAVARRRSPLNAIALTVSSIEIVCPVSQHSRLATSGYRRRHYELCQEWEGICRCCQLTSIGREGGVALVERVVRAARRNGGLPPGAADRRCGAARRTPPRWRRCRPRGGSATTGPAARPAGPGRRRRPAAPLARRCGRARTPGRPA